MSAKIKEGPRGTSNYAMVRNCVRPIDPPPKFNPAKVRTFGNLSHFMRGFGRLMQPFRVFPLNANSPGDACVRDNATEKVIKTEHLPARRRRRRQPSLFVVRPRGAN